MFDPLNGAIVSLGAAIAATGLFAGRWQPNSESMLQTYAPGSHMPASYCPERPEDAVLVPSVYPAVYPAVILVLGICVGMALFTGFRYLYFYA